MRHLLRLHHDGVRARGISRRLGVAGSTIRDNLKRAVAAGLAWPLADRFTDDALERQLFGRAGARRATAAGRADWAALALELKRPGVAMTILWGEYREVHYAAAASAICLAVSNGPYPVMRQHHVAGRRRSWTKRISIVDLSTGEIREAEIFPLRDMWPSVAARSPFRGGASHSGGGHKIPTT